VPSISLNASVSSTHHTQNDCNLEKSHGGICTIAMPGNGIHTTTLAYSHATLLFPAQPLQNMYHNRTHMQASPTPTHELPSFRIKKAASVRQQDCYCATTTTTTTTNTLCIDLPPLVCVPWRLKYYPRREPFPCKHGVTLTNNS